MDSADASLPDAPTVPADPISTEEPGPTTPSPATATPGALPVAEAGSQDQDPSKVAVPPQDEILRNCPYENFPDPVCRVHWSRLFISSSLFITFQNAGNAYTGYFYRTETTHGKWLDRYFASVAGYKFSVWSDGNPFLDDYVGHPLMGDITNFLWIQNDPKSMTLEFGNNSSYWRSRLRALAFSTAYSTEWKLGPVGESGVGHAGDHVAFDNGHYRVETGFVSLVTTPVGGALWTIYEDAFDRYVTQRLESMSRNPLALFAYQFLTPGKGAANILRFRPPWYRDSRIVKADGFWHNPSDEEDVEGEARASSTKYGNLPGGTHELGAWWGLSWHSSTLWGSQADTKYMPIDVRYSYRFVTRENWALRYSPEVTALAMLDEVNWDPVNAQTLRRRTYGSGVSPEGLQLDFRSSHRVQPFLSQNVGFIYFANRVFSPEGSPLVATIDFGGGVNIFRKQNQALTLGYRYQHLTNVNGSPNDSTDENTFYVGVSRFRNRASY